MLTVIYRDLTVTLTVIDGILVLSSILPIFCRVAIKSGRNRIPLLRSIS